MANLGFFAGGFSDALNTGLQRQSTANYQQQELEIQRQGQAAQQQRFEITQRQQLMSEVSAHLTETISELRAVGEDPKIIQGKIQGLQDQLRTLADSQGYKGYADSVVASAFGRPPKTQVQAAEAQAKETPATRAEKESLAKYRAAQADPFGLGPSGSQVTGVDVQEIPSGVPASPRAAVAATSGQFSAGDPVQTAQGTPQASIQLPQSEQDAKGDAFLASLNNPALSAAVKSVADYDVNPNSFLSRGTMASRAQFLGLVQQYATARGQTYDQTNFTTKNKAMQGFATRVQAISLADSELRNSLPILREANQAVNRTQYKTVNSLIEAFQEGTGGTAVVQLGEALNTTRNLYARAINPIGGKPTVNDLKHADDILQAAWSKGQIEAGVQQLLKEVDAAKASLPEARNEILGILSGKPQSSSAGSGGTKDQSKPSATYTYDPATGELR